MDSPVTRPGEYRSGTAQQVGHDHRSGDVAGCAQNEPQRGVGVDALGEVGMVADADEVETRLVGCAGVPEHLAHLLDAGLQPEAEEDVVVGGHDSSTVRDGQRYLCRAGRGHVATAAVGVRDRQLLVRSTDLLSAEAPRRALAS